MLSFDAASIEAWLCDQPGGQRLLEPGLGEASPPTVLLALERLADALEHRRTHDLDLLGRLCDGPPFQMAFRALAPHLSVGRRLRLVSWINEAGLPDGRAILTRLVDPAAAPVGSGAMIRADIHRLHRLGLLAAIFAPGRLARIRAACERTS